MTVKTKEQSAVTEPRAHNGFSLISNEKLLQLYTAMVQYRMIAERARNLSQRSAFAGKGEFAVGHEAAQVGVTIDLLPEDTIAPSHQGFMAGFIKGEPLDNIFSSLPVCAADPDLTMQLDIAIEAALANKTKKNGKIAVVFLDDRTASPGSWHKALKIADTHQLPILFVYQNSHSTGVSLLDAPTSGKEMALKVEACGFPGITVDGNDVVAVYRVATEAATQARKGNGATFIECHSQLIDGCPEIDPAKARDPILNMQMYLTRKGLFSEELKLEAAANFSNGLDAAVALSPHDISLFRHPLWAVE
ncbi:MAG: thiamine pyrophosphate-dependent enzyme [Terracidiphilus sp.]|jgi:pyruvate dehydrogenase E1 component alpha subunit